MSEPTRAELNEELMALDSTDRELLARRAENDLFFMAKGILGMKDLYPPLHKPLCTFLEDEDNKRRMVLMPRGTLKSSVNTVANNIRRAVRNPEVRILIANEVVENSVDFLGEIRGHFERNTRLRYFWPHVVPEKFAGAGVEWSTKGASVVRKGIYKEPTWYPAGVGSAVTSKHFTHLDLDDLIGLKAYESQAELLSAIRWNRNIEPLIISSEGPEATVITWTGTRWGETDLYQDVIDMYGEDLAVYHQGCYTSDGQSVFPAKLSLKFLERIAREEPARFAAQYLNDPTSSNILDFDINKVRTFVIDKDDDILYRENGEDFVVNAASLDRVMTLDANAGKKTSKDEFAAGVVGCDTDGSMFSLEDWGDRTSPDQVCREVEKMWLRWRPRVIGLEDVSGQWEFILTEYFKKRKMYPQIVPLRPDNQQKETRIRTLLQPMIGAGKVYIPMQQQVLRKQIKSFPNVKNDDRIDRFAYAVTLMRTPLKPERLKKNRSLVQRMLRLRNPITGY
jgi:phage terminase large subunit-like protein